MNPTATALRDARIESLHATPVLVPLRYTLGTSAAAIKAAPLLLLDVRTSDGLVGRAYTFAYKPSGARGIVHALDDALELIRGDPLAPLEIARKLERRFALSRDEAVELLSDAESASAESTQLFEFTRVIGRSFAHEERIELVEMICEVIYADGELHAHEDSLLRRIGELIYLRDRDRGAARQRVKRRLGLAG